MAVRRSGKKEADVSEVQPSLPPYLRVLSPGVCTLALHVKPNAKESSISGSDGQLNVSIHAAPRDGEANAAIVRYLSEVLGVRKGQVSLMAGGKSREKVVKVEEVSPDALLAALHRAVPSLAVEKAQSKLSSFFKPL